MQPLQLHYCRQKAASEDLFVSFSEIKKRQIKQPLNSQRQERYLSVFPVRMPI